NINIGVIAEFLNEIARFYLEIRKKIKVRSRYEQDGSFWYQMQTLSTARGLDTIVLDESQEKLLKEELETFLNNKDFYEIIGMPYRYRILLREKPGARITTSLINAISSHLSRDIY